MTKCEQINELGITVNSAFIPSANVLTAANKARGMLYFIKRSFTCLTREIFLPLYRALVRPHLEYAIQAKCPYLKKDVNHIERIQRAATRWAKGIGDLSYEERLRELKLQSLEKRRIRNDLVLTHKIMFHQIHLEASKLFKFSRRPRLRMSSLRLLQQTGRTLHARFYPSCYDCGNLIIIINIYICNNNNLYIRLSIVLGVKTWSNKMMNIIEWTNSYWMVRTCVHVTTRHKNE